MRVYGLPIGCAVGLCACALSDYVFGQSQYPLAVAAFLVWQDTARGLTNVITYRTAKTQVPALPCIMKLR
jgi:hypothetical protein